MAITVHWGSGSCPSWRVLLALELKRLPYTSHRIEFSRREHKAPEMLALNPRGRVPVLEDGGFALYESLAILAYLDAKYPEPPLLGRTPEQVGLIWRLVAECVFYFEPAVDGVCVPIYDGSAKQSADAVRAAAATVREEIARVEQRLERGPWLAGEQVTAADVAYVPMFGHLHRAAGKPIAAELDLGLVPIASHAPRTAEWWKRVQSLPGYDRTYPPHWR
jgi:glutathione S-transferase